MDIYSVLEGYANKFKEVGRIVDTGKNIFLVGFDEEREKFYSEIGRGEKVYTPKDKDYIKILTDVFRFSSSVAIKPIEIKKERKDY